MCISLVAMWKPYSVGEILPFFFLILVSLKDSTLNILLTLEQHGFELLESTSLESTSLWIFFFFWWVHGTGLGLACRRCWKVDTVGQLLSCTQAGLHPSPHPTVVQGPAAILQWCKCIQTHVLNMSQSLCLFMFSPKNKSAWMTAIVQLTQIPQESLL